MKQDTIQCLCDSASGIYIPQRFLNECRHWTGFTPWSLQALSAGPDNDEYWHAWEQTLDNAFLIVDGREFTLHQDGDLFAVCLDEMSEEEQADFFS